MAINLPKPSTLVYSMSSGELKALLEQYIKEQTGLQVDLELGVDEEDFDVYCGLADPSVLIDEEWERLGQIGGCDSPYEGLQNLLSGIFGGRPVCVKACCLSAPADGFDLEIYVSLLPEDQVQLQLTV